MPIRLGDYALDTIGRGEFHPFRRTISLRGIRCPQLSSPRRLVDHPHGNSVEITDTHGVGG